VDFGQQRVVAVPQKVCALELLEHWQKPRDEGTVTVMACKQFAHGCNTITSVENLLAAWREFVIGKHHRRDVQEFEIRLMDNILALHRDLAAGTYHHSSYEAFSISDPKPRRIHKATVRDRLLHHAIHRILYPFFDRTFIAHSYSCRVGKGMHRALNVFRTFARKSSRNHTRTAWVLKCDVKQFFATIDHGTLIAILRAHIQDQEIVELLAEVIQSFRSGQSGIGLPLGNLTSQLFANVYMNRLDHFVKHALRARHYIRYSDDFVILSMDRVWLEAILPQIDGFLRAELKLSLHPGKVSIHTAASGIDFLGWVHFPDHRVLRTVTKRRMMHRIQLKARGRQTLRSYRGLLSHGNTCKLERHLTNFEEGASGKVLPPR